MSVIRYPYRGKGFSSRSAQQSPAYSKEQLVGFYRSMLRIRIIEEEIEKRYKEDHMKTPVHLVIGQEATSVGLCSALKTSDQIYCTHRTHGAYLAKGGDLNAMMSELHCKSDGCAASRGGSMHLIDKKVGMAGTSAIVGGILPIATGAALAMQMKKTNDVTAVMFGEAANEEGVTSESLNFAALKKLPIIFFCENNFYSVCSPLSTRQPIVDMYKRAAGFGLEAIQIDGTNVIDVYEASMKAVEKARKGGGPTFIEALVYRFRAHAGAGDDSQTGYRTVDERESWEKNADPIPSFADHLESLKILDEKKKKQIEDEINKEVLNSFEHAMKSPVPTEKDLLTHVYAMG